MNLLRLVATVVLALTLPAGAAEVAATFASAATVPVTAAGYSATGNTVHPALNFTPPTGTSLTVVSNTGVGFIDGAFSNLVQGQTVTLGFGGVDYQFVANYYGGSGNDLVLQWANTRLVAWGGNSNGSLGTGNSAGSSTPVRVDMTGVLAGKVVTRLAAATSRSLVLCADGTLVNWGSNHSGTGSLGNGSWPDSPMPVLVDQTGVLAGKTVVAIAAGGYHSLALGVDGTLAAWGSDSWGQLGHGGTSSNVPVLVDRTGVLAGKSIVAVAAGENHSLALCADGDIAAWGSNATGQLGNNSTVNSGVPVLVDRAGVLAGKTVVAVAAGNYHSLAHCSDGSLVAWGASGTLGNNATANSLVPVLVDGSGILAAKSPVAASAGGGHNLALCSDGTLAAWGYNANGQLGNNGTATGLVPVAVVQTGVLAGRTVVGIAAGGAHSLALGADGTIAAWGKGYSGELGNNSLAQSTVPVWVDTRDLGAGERFVAASAGADHSLALVASPPPPVATTLAATGIVDTGATLHGNVNAQGTVTTVTFHYGTTTSYGWTMNAVPVTVSGAATTAATAVLAGLSAGTTYHYRIVATSPGGTVWGEDLTFTTTNQAYLTQLTLAGGTLLPEFASGITGYAAAVPFTTGSITVTPVVGLPTSTVRVNGTLVASGDASGPINLAVGNNVITIAVTAADGSNTKNYRVTVTRLPEIYAFGSGTTVPVVVSDFKATGNAATFALNFVPPAGTNLTVVNNTGREPIRGTFSNLAQGQPVQLTYGGINYAFVANYFGGTGNDLVLQWANNRLLAWGDNFFGALGNGGTTNSYVPTPVTLGGALAGKTIIALAAGFSNSAALCSDGTVAEWGNGVTGTPRLASRTGVLAGKMAVAISAGNTHRLALCADGTVVAWGENSNGQLGDGTTYTSRDPVLVNRTGVLAGKRVIAIAAGTRHSLALGSDGTLAAWGSNNGGQLGNNSTTNSPVPVLVDQSGVLFGKTVVAIAAGLEVCYALCSDGSVASWGSGAFGQLGNHRTLSSSVPVLVDRSGVLANRTIAAISAGASHAAVFCTNRSVAAWGVNASGELGSAPTDTSTPSLVYTGGYLSQKTVTGITAGGSHNLAFCTDGGLVAWGRNNQGQLGNGLTTEGGPVLIRMEALKTGERFVAAACGSYHSLGLVASPPLALVTTLPATDITRTSGTLNGNAIAQGNLTAVSFEYGLTTAYGTVVAATPGSVTGTTATAASALVTGLQPGTIYHYRIIATNSGGTAKGEDMTLTTPDFACLASLSMTDATLVPGFSMIQSGYIATVPFATSRVSLTPVAVYGSSSITVNGNPVASGVASEPIELAVGNNVIQTVVTDVDGTRTYGITVTRLPEIFRFDSAATVPVTVSDFEAGGHSATFALNFAPGAGTNFTVVNNTGPRFIRGTFTNLAHGQVVTLPFGGVAYRFVANYYGGSGNDLVLHWAANRLFAWGSNFSGQLGDGTTTSNDLPKPLGDLGSLASKMILAGAVGYGFNLVLAADGTLAAWGENGDGQLGNGGTVDSKVPVAVNQTGVLAGKTVVAVAASYDRCLVLCSDGTLATWGKGATSKMPELVSQTGALAGKSVVAIAAGYDHCLALCDDGTVAAWGGNDSGQLGNGSREWPGLPVAVDTLGVLADKQVTAIAAGNYFSLALCNDGTVAAWGSNTWGRLGADWGPYPTNLPVAVSRAGVLAGKTVVALAAGNSHALALCADGAMVAWGFNSSGQLGNGNTTDSPVPVSVNQTGVLAGKMIIGVAAGYQHSRAWCADGTLAAWGSNSDVELGNGSFNSSSLPVTVNGGGLASGERFSAQFSGHYATHDLALVAMPFIPRIAVESPAGSPVAKRGATVDFGAVAVGNAITRGFTIRNAGLEPLVISSATLDGPNAADFGLTVPPTATVAAGSSTTFEVTFTATTGFARSAVLRLVSNDPEAGLTEIQLAATVTGVLNGVYATGGEIPVSAAAFTATGSTVNLSLAHAPATGSPLMVVRNDGLGFINGEFSNLAQGQVVELGHAGNTYKFVANYYGGSGNDLVLQWAASRAFGWGANTSGQLGTGTTTPSKLPLEVPTTGILGGKTISGLAAGKSHSLALGSDGTLAAWGSNGYGQLGIGNNTDSKVPVAVSTAGVLNGKRVVAVAAGTYHNLALCADGTLAAWGYNSDGVLGDGTTTNRNLPVAVDTTGVLAGKTVVAVAAGAVHSLALCSDGTVAAWGGNFYGLLGDGSMLARSRPVAVSVTGALAGKRVVAIAAGLAHSLAVCADGSVVAWGRNSSGQLGNGGAMDSSKFPVRVDATGVLNGRTVLAVAAGAYHSLAWCADGALAAWGDNGSGQLGNGSQTQSNVPVAVNISGVLAGTSLGGVSAGNNSSVARGADGTVAAWGANTYGQLGDSSTNTRLTPVAVDPSGLAPGWRLMAGISGQGADHTLGLVALPFIPRVVVEQPVGTVLANGSGKVDFESGAVNAVTAKTFTIRNRGVEPLLLGEASISGPQAAEFVLTTPPAATVAPGDSTTLVVTFTAGAGFNRRADLRFPTNDPYAGEVHLSLTATGTGTLEAAYGSGGDVPLTVAGFQATGSTVNFVLNFVPVPGTALTVVRNTGAAFIQGVFSNLAQGGEMMLSHGGRSYRFVANYYGGSGNDLVLLWAAARPVAWGRNSSGQLGIGGSTQSNFPAAVDMTGVLAGKRMVAAAASRNHSLALCADGTLAGWGSNLNGELGTGTTASSQTPVAAGVGGALAGRTVVAIATGSFFSLALGSDGMVAAWGSNSSGQLGNGGYTTSTVPVAVSTTGALAGKAVVAIAAGSAHCLALCADGTLAAWGSNADGQLGFGNYTDRNVPGLVYTAGVLAGKTVVAVAAGNSHSLALCADGTLVAWGSNAAGKLGTGTTSSSAMPVAVSTSGVLAGKTVVAMAAGERHSLALCADGTLAAWGSNTNGELGNGTTASSSVPVAVVADGMLAGKTPVALTAGFSHSLALCSDGTLVGWGYNFYGQLGNGSTTKSLVPMAVSRGSLLDGECIIAGTSGASAYHSLGLVASPRVRFAGYAISTPFQTAVTVSLAKLLAEAADSDGDSISVTAAGPASAQGGTAVLQDGGVVYTPPTGFSGADSFSVTLADAGGASVIGTVTVTVGPNPNSGGMGVNPPVLTVLPGGKMGLAFQGIPGRSYIVQRSVSGLDNWVTLATLVADASGKVAYTDESPPAGSAFYRLGLP